MPDGKRANIPVRTENSEHLPLAQDHIFDDIVTSHGVGQTLFDGVTDLHEELLHDFKSLPRKSKTDLDDFVVINVGPSILPAYVPSFRVFQYNITGYQAGKPIAKWRQKLDVEPEADDLGDEGEADDEDDQEDDQEDNESTHDDDKTLADSFKDKYSHLKEKKRSKKGKEKTKGKKRRHGHRRHPKPDCDKDHNKNRRECEPLPPRHADPKSPSRTNSLWSPLGYAQVCEIAHASDNLTTPLTVIPVLLTRYRHR